jgi:tetratricopeptide (TPR) repeat protein
MCSIRTLAWVRKTGGRLGFFDRLTLTRQAAWMRVLHKKQIKINFSAARFDANDYAILDTNAAKRAIAASGIFLLSLYMAVAAPSGGESPNATERAEGCAALLTRGGCAIGSAESGHASGVDEDEADFELGHRAIEKGDRISAVEHFRRVIEHNPNHRLARLNRGAAFLELGKITDAISDLSEVIRINGDDADALYNRALAFRQEGAYDKAVNDLDRVIRIDPGKPEAYNERGFVYELTGQNELALSDYANAARLRPGSAKAYSNRGFLLVRLGRLDEAETDFNKGLLREHASSYLLYGLGLVHQSRGDCMDALPLFDAAVTSPPQEFFEPYLNRAECYFSLNQLDSAIADYTIFLVHDPTRSTAYEGRGQAHLGKGETFAAVSDFNSAVALPAHSNADEKARQRAFDFLKRLTR